MSGKTTSLKTNFPTRILYHRSILHKTINNQILQTTKAKKKMKFEHKNGKGGCWKLKPIKCTSLIYSTIIQNVTPSFICGSVGVFKTLLRDKTQPDCYPFNPPINNSNSRIWSQLVQREPLEVSKVTGTM